MDAQFLQHGFDPHVAGQSLFVVDIIEGEGLFKRKQMLRPVVAGEGLRDRVRTGVITVMAQARQRLRIALAGKDRANDAQARAPVMSATTRRSKRRARL
jgi:hypothetical protein